MHFPLKMKQINNIIEQAIRSFEASVEIPNTSTENDVYVAIRQVMRDNPDIFWFSHQWSYSHSETVVRFRYPIDEIRSKKIWTQIDDVVENDFKLNFARTLYVKEQVMYVYKWVALYCNYSIHSAHNQTIYSVFVHRHSVCTGIAKATQYLLKLLGIESRLVFGKMNNSEKDSRHCWLIVNIDGQWYHLDPTFALPETEHLLHQCGVKPAKGDDLLFYNFFCVDTEAIKQSRTIEEEELLPTCSNNIDYTPLQQIKVTPSRNGESFGLGCVLSNVGTTANIYLAHDKDKYNRHRFVAKVFRHDDDHELLRKEQKVMRECAGSPHLLRAGGADFDKGILYMEQATPLSELLASHYYKLTLKGLCNLLIDVASGLKELLAHGIFYRDIHLNNIFLCEDPIFGKLTYKLGDFGSCTFVDKDGKYAGLTERGGVGSKWYMAPETWNNGIFDERSAVYGIGMIAYYLLNDLYPPFWKSCKFDAADIRYGGREIDELDLRFIYNPLIITNLYAIVVRALCFESQQRHQNLSELILDFDRLFQVLGNEDYSIPFTNTDLDFGRTIVGGSIKTTTINDEFVEAEIECLNCGSHFEVSILQKLIDQMLPALPPDNAYGSLSLCIKDETDTIPCPHCGFKNTLKDSVKHDKLNLLPIEHKQQTSRIDDFATTCIPNTSADSSSDESSNHRTAASETYSRQRIDDFATTCAPRFPNSASPYEDNIQQNSPSETYFPLGENSPSRTPKENKTYASPTPKSSNGLFGKLKKLFIGKSEGTSPSPANKVTLVAEKVNSSIFAPSETKRGDYMMVQVFLYKDDEERAVACKAAEVDPDARRQNFTPLSVKLMDGDNVKAKLMMSGKGIEVDEPIQEMIWQGHYTDCQFGVYVPEEYKPTSMMGTVMLTVNDIPCGRMMFKTKIVSQPQKLYAKIESKAFQKIFISYSHKDEATVKYFAKAFQAQGVDYFFDRHYLKAGDVYPLKIKEYINSADLFILCWSKNAAESDYVQLERQQALALAFPQKDMEQATLSIHPISIAPHADYPSDMKELYNFEEI